MTRRLMLLCVGLALISMPGSALAKARQDHNDISIVKDSQFDRAHGVRSGTGTMEDPYVISGWAVNNMSIRDTSKAVRIENNTVRGQLRLNWVGHDVEVHRNDIGDLRVNENIKRKGEPTAGMIEHNHFDVVGQLRHFDGSFSHNVVGSPGASLLTFSKYPNTEAVNFDGFNGAIFQDNTLYGYLTARLHGHHHSSSYTSMSHMHTGSMHDGINHASRYHRVTIANNRIFSGGPYAIEYVDNNHAGNDRTATSETNTALNKPHIHHTRVSILNNYVYGAGIWVDIFNAVDQLHKTFAMGSVRIAGNHIDMTGGSLTNHVPFLTVPSAGILVQSARYLTLAIQNNVVTDTPRLNNDAYRSDIARTVGIYLVQLTHGSAVIDGNRISHMTTALQATTFSTTFVWRVVNMTTDDVQQGVVYDSSVRNKPKTS